MALTTATATIPPGWSPSTSCQNTSDIWVWNDGAWGMGVLGPPDQSSSCHPPDFTPTLGQLYTANSCPDGFTAACTTNYYSYSWSTLCCPSGEFSYTCNYKSFWSWTAACATSKSPYSTTQTAISTSFGKSARSTDGTVIAPDLVVLDGDLAVSTDLTTTGTFTFLATYAPDQSMWAFGVPIVPPASTSSTVTSSTSSVPSTAVSDTTSSSHGLSSSPGPNPSIMPSTSPSTAPETSSTSGLSAGVSAGIAIGSLIAIIFIALGIWYLYRRRVKKREHSSNMDLSARHHSAVSQQTKPTVSWRSEEHIPQRSPGEVQDSRRYELDVMRRYPELP